MHHDVLDRWSRGDSPLHRRDARVKIIAALLLLILIAASHRHLPPLLSSLFLLLLIAIAAARLPLSHLLARAALVLPFTAVFAVLRLFEGQSRLAAVLVAKSYLSALAALLLVSTTPLPQLLRALEQLRVPRVLVMTSQFLYRYLFVISQEAHQMRIAAVSRGGLTRRLNARRRQFQAAAGILAVLFARSRSRAVSIHNAMLARSFTETLPVLSTPVLQPADALLLLLSTASLGFLRWTS